MSRRLWTREEQLLALRLYFLLPFGQLHQKHKEIIAVAKAIDRTPSAVAMKACNFASLDPALSRQGLSNVSKSDRELWKEFMSDSMLLSSDADDVYKKIISAKSSVINEALYPKYIGLTESVSEVKVRRAQGFFRKSVMVSYNNKCAISGLNIPEMIIASHIIPWSIDEKRRADPTNGIALNALYDKAFDRGYLTFSDELRVILSEKLHEKLENNERARLLFNIDGQKMILPSRFYPDMEAIKYHRNDVFVDNQ